MPDSFDKNSPGKSQRKTIPDLLKDAADIMKYTLYPLRNAVPPTLPKENPNTPGTAKPGLEIPSKSKGVEDLPDRKYIFGAGPALVSKAVLNSVIEKPKGGVDDPTARLVTALDKHLETAKLTALGAVSSLQTKTPYAEPAAPKWEAPKVSDRASEGRASNSYEVLGTMKPGFIPAKPASKTNPER